MPAEMMVQLWLRMLVRVQGDRPDRGDVPGWVMVTIMSAGLVVAILAAARGPLVEAISNAIDSVTNASGG